MNQYICKNCTCPTNVKDAGKAFCETSCPLQDTPGYPGKFDQVRVDYLTPQDRALRDVITHQDVRDSARRVDRLLAQDARNSMARMADNMITIT